MLLRVSVPLVDKLIEGQRSLVHAKRGVPRLDEEVCGSLPMKPVMSPSSLSKVDHIPRFELPAPRETQDHAPPVTQLYLSVDAANPDTLAEIDRPYVGKTDAWRRLNETIRITVIKKLNCRREDIPGYVKLIRLGPPCFIELKAFSFVGGTRHRHAFFLSSLLPTFTPARPVC
ncbi:S-adenosyl-L-methionine-dependent tRNA 4-demethylwyosine synthase like protein [Aduncisulcus paluster]|uniref:S-adenosyl-L-methionine-dependent tRNA 4-demethylwyosine synthase like protein n=1 Tax=Aduncisulcus paluster TaxID=2918883 RepID=A0ABQ5KQK6_9EUKA|nr:S-adenosyl-L-methionine-dependent tRNA 4-demethylwyosine synthase like protein [Aduncisulcus paluster]